jgi:hypothetical protein
LKKQWFAAVTRYHAGHPLEDGMPREEARERLFARAPCLCSNTYCVSSQTGNGSSRATGSRFAGHNVALTHDEARARDAMVETLRAAKLMPPDPSMLATQIGVPLEVVHPHRNVARPAIGTRARRRSAVPRVCDEAAQVRDSVAEAERSDKYDRRRVVQGSLQHHAQVRHSAAGVSRP